MNVPVGFDKDDIINPYDKYLSGYHFRDLQVYLLAYRHLRCPEVFTCEIEKDDMVDPFDESNPFNRA